MSKGFDKRIHRSEILICLLLVVATVAVFWQVQGCEFLNYDDNQYVTENRHVRDGLTKQSVIWAFSTFHFSNWHPMTWVSHMLTCQLFGMNPGWHHLGNLLLHIMNTILLFITFRRMTGDLWRSGLVAVLFALHPLHVESVAWVSERKGVLSTFFWILTMWAYVRYVQRPMRRTYLVALLAFALGLMSKPMVVTLPFVLLLLDFWPLGRFQIEESGGIGVIKGGKSRSPVYQRSLLLGLLLEKAPFLVLAGVSSVVTFVAQQSGGAVLSLQAVPIQMRVANALISYVSYIGKMIWPHRLAVFYPYPTVLPTLQALGAGLLLVCICLLILWRVRRFPYMAVGWFWYLGTLVPVIGLVQVGEQAMADRYTYVPLIGLFIIIAWGSADLAARWRLSNLLMGLSTGAVFLVLATCSWFQVARWQNTMTLFEHAIHVTSDNYLALNNLGNVLAEQGELEEAVTRYLEAVRIQPEYAVAHNNLGITLHEQGRFDEAVDHFLEALRIKSDFAVAHNNLGITYFAEGKIDEAMARYSKALEIWPDYADAHNSLAITLASQNKLDKAIPHFSKVLRMNPGHALAHYNLGVALQRQGRLDEAIARFSDALRLKPDYAAACYNLAIAYFKNGNYKKAIDYCDKAVELGADIEPQFLEWLKPFR